MKLKQVAQMRSGQDGAFFGDFMFRFDARGNGTVYDARVLDAADGVIADLPVIARFSMNAGDAVIPHCNAVVFGCEYAAEGDEFPLLYANVYNNCAKEENRREGTCCVYRLQRSGTEFSVTLVQMIRVGFVHTPLWKSDGDIQDVRPYGNFVIDREKRLLHAFTMRDAQRVTRYFTFPLPRLSEGETDPQTGVRTVVLTESDLLDSFDTEYHLFIQGACCEGGRIYSSEGFNEKVHPSLRVIDPAEKKQLLHVDLTTLGEVGEAEWIDFRGGRCCYSDGDGKVFLVDFEM